MPGIPAGIVDKPDRPEEPLLPKNKVELPEPRKNYRERERDPKDKPIMDRGDFRHGEGLGGRFR